MAPSSSSSHRLQLLDKAMFEHRVMHSQSFLPCGAGVTLQSALICFCGLNTSSLLSYYKLSPSFKSPSSSVIPGWEFNFSAWVGCVIALIRPSALSCLVYKTSIFKGETVTKVIGVILFKHSQTEVAIDGTNCSSSKLQYFRWNCHLSPCVPAQKYVVNLTSHLILITLDCTWYQIRRGVSLTH